MSANQYLHEVAVTAIVQNENVDIVDEQDVVLYQTTKKDAHENGLLHRTIIGGVILSNGKRMLIRQSSGRQDPGQFVSPVGGHIMAGESEEEALRREAFEELGLKSFEYRFIGKVVYNRKVLDRHENHYFIYYEIYSDEMPTLNYESDGFEIFIQDQLKQEIKENPKKFGPPFHFIAEHFL